MDADSSIASAAALPDAMQGIPEFYAGKSLFLTGATGFIGKTTLEKLLRSCPDVKQIYVLVRAGKRRNSVTRQKESRTHTERLGDLFDQPLFEKVRRMYPECLKKVTPVQGDIAMDNLGMCDEDWKELCANVTIIIHIAATVKFQEKIKLALKLNIFGVRNIVALAKDLKKCECVLHTSTAYSHSYKNNLEEEFLPATYDVDTLVKVLDLLTDEQADALTPAIIKPHPNTYTFTKCLAEGIMNAHAHELPVCVVRPAIVVAAWRQPTKGWTDTLNGPAGLAIMIGMGILRSVQATADVSPGLVPVDIVANYLVVAPWDVATRGNRGRVYNCTGQENRMSWGTFAARVMEHFRRDPLTDVIRYPSIVLIKPGHWNFGQKLQAFWNFVCHQTPAATANTVAWWQGKESSKLGKGLSMTMTVMNEYQPWLNAEWFWDYDHQDEIMKAMPAKDRHDFELSTKNMDWAEYMRHFTEGLRPMLSKDGIAPAKTEVVQARRKLTFIIWQEFLMRGLSTAFVWKMLYSLRIIKRNISPSRYTLLTLIMSSVFFQQFRIWSANARDMFDRAASAYGPKS